MPEKCYHHVSPIAEKVMAGYLTRTAAARIFGPDRLRVNESRAYDYPHVLNIFKSFKGHQRQWEAGKYSTELEAKLAVEEKALLSIVNRDMPVMEALLETSPLKENERRYLELLRTILTFLSNLEKNEPLRIEQNSRRPIEPILVENVEPDTPSDEQSALFNDNPRLRDPFAELLDERLNDW